MEKTLSPMKRILFFIFLALFFNSASTTQYRLVRLFQHGFLQRQYPLLPIGNSTTTAPIYTLGVHGAQILIDLGLKDIRVLTNHPKKVVALEGYGIRIADQVPLRIEQPRPTHQTL